MLEKTLCHIVQDIPENREYNRAGAGQTRPQRASSGVGAGPSGAAHRKHNQQRVSFLTASWPGRRKVLRKVNLGPLNYGQMTLNQVLSELQVAQAESGRPEGGVRLVVVSKGQPLDAIEQKILANASALPAPVMLAENRGQELRDKVREARERGWQERFPPTEWHFIGPLQRNKIKYLEPVSLIHTLEAAWQVQAIAQAAEGWGHAPAVLIQLHNGEAQKHGVAPEDAAALYHAAVQSGLEVRGLMVMAPYGDPEAARQVFGRAARCAADLNLSELSMGMSDDFIPAIQQGATLVRIGRRLFT